MTQPTAAKAAKLEFECGLVLDNQTLGKRYNWHDQFR